MITLPAPLEKVMQSKDLEGLKPFAVLFRNKWDSVNNKYALDTANPVDISAMISKPNTLSMTLDVNEVAQYNANNVTLTLADTQNRFIEGTQNSYFPAGYQLYGSRVVLYYGIDSTNKTALFTGVIKDLPTYKPGNYQVDLKLVSPLEMLKDIEAKEFSDKVTGETLTFIETDTDGHKVYHTSGTGVGGFNAVYANGNKLFEGIDYEIDQTSVLSVPAVVTIINSDYYSATITADYYTWKTGLTVEQIVAGLVGLAGYDSGTEDIRNVVWNTEVRTAIYPDLIMSLGYRKNGTNYNPSGDLSFFNTVFTGINYHFLHSDLPSNFSISFSANFSSNANVGLYYSFGEITGNTSDYYGGLVNGIQVICYRDYNYNNIAVRQCVNGNYGIQTIVSETHSTGDVPVNIIINSNTAYISGSTGAATYNFNSGFSWGVNSNYNHAIRSNTYNTFYVKNFTLTALDDNNNIIASLYRPGILVQAGNGTDTTFVGLNAAFSDTDSQYELSYRCANDVNSWSEWQAISFNSYIGTNSKYLQAVLNITSQFPVINSYSVFYLGSSLTLQLVNLSDKTVLEALQDFALISSYEFGVDRNGVFFFRPRVSSTTPTYELGHSDIVKVETVKKNLSDFFTKLTLTFAQVPLEFYANSGTRPTQVDKYGIINKEIDKPDIVNYDNPELAQAIGPQLLEVYSAMPNMIQATGKLNLALELGDIVNLKRNYNLVEPGSASDYTKFAAQQTYYRACKITGMNYNFAKKQITYTLRDVSNQNNSPIENAEMWEFVYDLPIQLGAK